jgi:hypothetical protein
LPGDEAPLPAAPTPAPTPEPLNPFDGSQVDPAPLGFDPAPLDDDPPPALPPSLQSSRRGRDLRRAEQAAKRSGTTVGVTRLPGTHSETDPYAVRQASATVWASGTDDIRPADPNAGRVQQAIHHEPVK